MSKISNDSLIVKLIKLPIVLALAAITLVVDVAFGLLGDCVDYAKALSSVAVSIVQASVEYAVEVWGHTVDLATSTIDRAKSAVSDVVNTITENL